VEGHRHGEGIEMSKHSTLQCTTIHHFHDLIVTFQFGTLIN